MVAENFDYVRNNTYGRTTSFENSPFRLYPRHNYAHEYTLMDK